MTKPIYAECKCKEARRVLKEAVRQGWRVKDGKHLKFTSPNGKVITVSKSPSYSNVAKEIEHDFRRAGLCICS